MKRQRRSAIDPAVASLVTEGERRQRRRRLPRARQAKARKDAARQRATYDIPKEVARAVAEVAKEEGVSASAVAALLLAEGLRRLEVGEVSLHGLKEPSRSPKYDWQVPTRAVLEVLKGDRTLLVRK